MDPNTPDSPKSRKPEIVIAVIGLVGVLATATISNMDKLFPDKDMIQAKVAGYRATGNFETELRYYFEVSGGRLMLTNMQTQLLASLKAMALTQHPEQAKDIAIEFKAIEDDPMRFDDVIAKLLPIYQKFFTIQEIQDLNRFYSTETMQGMVKKMPLLTQELAPVQVKLIQEYQSRLIQKIGNKLDPD